MVIRVRFHVRSFPRLFPRSVFKEGHQCGDCKIRTESRQSRTLHVGANGEHRSGKLTVNSRPVEAVPGDHEGPLVGIRGRRRRRRKSGIVLLAVVIGGERPSSSLPRRVVKVRRSAFTGGGKRAFFSVIRR